MNFQLEICNSFQIIVLSCGTEEPLALFGIDSSGTCYHHAVLVQSGSASITTGGLRLRLAEEWGQ